MIDTIHVSVACRPKNGIAVKWLLLQSCILQDQLFTWGLKKFANNADSAARRFSSRIVAMPSNPPYGIEALRKIEFVVKNGKVIRRP